VNPWPTVRLGGALRHRKEFITIDGLNTYKRPRVQLHAKGIVLRVRLRLAPERAEPRLVASYINSPVGRAYMLSEKKQMTGQANVNSSTLKALPIALPSLSEQRRIVAELDDLQAKVDKLKRLQAGTAAELDALLPSILDRVFKGEL
jgi:type I restriction enzyme S subunit